MAPSYRHLEVERQGDVYCVRLRPGHLQETDILEMADEMHSLIVDEGCRRMAIALGPETVDCLYSVFLAKLVGVRRRMLECGGHLVLCDLHPAVVGVFEACRLKEYFEFVPDRATAVDRLRTLPTGS